MKKLGRVFCVISIAIMLSACATCGGNGGSCSSSSNVCGGGGGGCGCSGGCGTYSY